MDNYIPMRWIRISLGYSLVLWLCKNLYGDITPYLIFHYPFFDFRYFLFLAIQIFWSLVFYQIIYQYLCLSTFISLRLNRKQKIQLYLKQWIKYLCFYTVIHVIVLSILSLPIPIDLFIMQLCIWSLFFMILVVLHQKWSYHYVSMILMVIGIHLII